MMCGYVAAMKLRSTGMNITNRPGAKNSVLPFLINFRSLVNTRLLVNSHRKVLLALCVSVSQFALAQTCTLPANPETDYDFKIENDFFGANPKAPTDYYKLAVNWSGDYCQKILAEIADRKSVV